jgi:general secretion pathway protein I
MHKKCGGMTLIEVLVAFVVLSVTMAVILQIFTGGMRNARLSDGYSRAVFLAESRLAAVGVERPMVSGEDGGSVGQDLQWRVSIRQVDDQGGPGSQLLPLRLYEVRVQVRWAEDGRDRQFALNSLRLGPPQ